MAVLVPYLFETELSFAEYQTLYRKDVDVRSKQRLLLHRTSLALTA